MSPANLLPDKHGRIPNAVGQKLMSSAYGFLIGQLDSSAGRFSLWETIEGKNIRAEDMDILVYSLWDRTVGAPGLKSADIKRLSSYSYYHEYYDDAIYKTSGTQTFVFKAASHSQLRVLVEQAIKIKTESIAYADKCMQQFEANKLRIKAAILKELESLTKVEVSKEYELLIYDESDDWTAWNVHEKPLPEMRAFKDCLKLQVVTGGMYWHDQAGANQCKDDVKVVKRMVAEGKLV